MLPAFALALLRPVVLEEMSVLLSPEGADPTMIHALDHIALTVRDLAAAVAGYELLFGRRAVAAAGTGVVAGANFQLANTRLELRTALAGEPEGLSLLGFATADLGKAESLLQRRGLPVMRQGGVRAIDVARAATHGTGISLVEQAPSATQPASSPSASSEPDAIVARLDHVVVRSPNPERAVALYAGRLGLNLRLDRSEPAWGARLLFFRCGDLIVEVAHDLKAGVSDAPDRLWGLSWHVADVAKAHAGLRAAGVDVSEVRTGRRPHTKVFTVRSHSAGVPTLMIGAGE